MDIPAAHFARNTAVSSLVFKPLELDMTAVGRRELQAPAWVLDGNHRAPQALDRYPHAFDEAPPSNCDVFQ